MIKVPEVDMKKFSEEVQERLFRNGSDLSLQAAARDFIKKSTEPKYSYNFSWMGRPIIQYPQDIVAMQELIWKIKPDLIIETGIAHGGSLIFSAAMLELNAACGGPANAEVLGIDIDIRSHNRLAIEAHPMAKRISMIQGSSIAPNIITRVWEISRTRQNILVCLDSNHTHEHVLAELNAYANLTSVDSYCVVFDTIIEDMPEGSYPERSWAPGNNPRTAVWEFLRTNKQFQIDKSIDNKLLISVAPDGYLKRTSL
jgi:cephalosporin hydroxylase